MNREMCACELCEVGHARVIPQTRSTRAFFALFAGPVRGLVEIVPIFHTVFARVYHYAISELCKGLYHHNGV